MMKTIALMLMCALGLGACAAANANWARARSQGHVPCRQNQIEIVEQNAVGSLWTARCKGKLYYCSWAASGGTGGAVTCSPAD